MFAHPLLLAGAGMVALPIVLHLIMRRQPRNLEFPALRFVQQRKETTQRNLKLRHLLLLLLRMLIIALLAAALARPSVRLSSSALGSQEAPVAAALVFDTAPRMDYRQDNRTRLDVAKEFGRKLLAQLPKESQIAVLDTQLAPAVFQADRGSAGQRIERLQTVANSQPLTRVLDDALQLIGHNDLPRKELYVFSDLARPAWPATAAARLQDLLHATPATVYVIDVGTTQPVNFALGDVRLSSQVLAQRSALQIDTDLSCLGPGGERTVELFLLDSQRQPQRASAQVCTLAAGASQHIEFRADGLDLGTHQGFLRVVGQDGLAADDTRFFTVEVRPAWRVLIAAPPPAAAKAVYLTQALAPTAMQKQGQSRFDCDVLALDQLTATSLAPYAAVCLVDPTPLDAAVWRKLVNFAAEGHGVGIFLGRNAANLEAFNDDAAQELLPAKLVRQARRPDGTLYLAPRDYEKSMLAAFRDYASSIPWNQFPVFRYWQLEKLAPGVNVIASYNDGGAAILQRPINAGRSITFTTPVSDRPNQDPWNLLPSGEAWPFVILANQMLAELVGVGEQQFNYFAGQTAVLQFDRQTPQTSFIVSTPLDEKLPLPLDAEKGVLAVTGTDAAGNYRVQAGGEASGVDRGFSVNLAAEQTQLTRVPEDQLAAMFRPFDYRLVKSEDQLDRAVSTARVGRELFPLLILAVALVLGAEHVLANRFYRE